MEEAGIKPPKKDSTILAALPYILSVMVGVIIYLIAKDDKFSRFHALQSIMFDIALMPIFFLEFIIYVILMITIIGAFVMWFVILFTALAAFLFRLYMAYSAFQGESPMIPVIGKMALERI